MAVLQTPLDHQRATGYDVMYDDVTGPNYWQPDIAVVKMTEQLRPEALVCDVAAGAGRHTLHVAQFGHRVTALDYSPCGVEKTEELARQAGLDGLIEARHANVRDGLPDGQFDGLIMSLLFHYLTPVEVTNLVQWAMEHTAAGGLHALVFYFDAEHLRDGDYLDGFIPVDPAEVTSRYIEAGWQVRGDARSYTWGVPVYSAVLQCPGG